MALEPGEEIEVLTTDWAEALAMVQDGRIEDAKTLAGILYYQTFGPNAISSVEE